MMISSQRMKIMPTNPITIHKSFELPVFWQISKDDVIETIIVYPGAFLCLLDLF